MSIQTKDNQPVVNVSQASYAFYLSGMAKGRLETLKGLQTQLESLTGHYKTQIEPIVSEQSEGIDTATIIDVLKQVVDSFGTIPTQVEAEIPKVEKEAIELEMKAINLESTRSKRFSKRLMDSIDGFVDGWNR